MKKCFPVLSTWCSTNRGAQPGKTIYKNRKITDCMNGINYVKLFSCVVMLRGVLGILKKL
ncbi:hypothetical protein A4D02_22735 [Niastella koreensis]|uniref:Transposase n=1 Tax=Niastella koreensis TaxID=354356 RepID=A0ABX3P1Y9_9BACT|nr:hypothetical protein A4D02_22735 [Niastella koreensis]